MAPTKRTRATILERSVDSEILNADVTETLAKGDEEHKDVDLTSAFDGIAVEMSEQKVPLVPVTPLMTAFAGPSGPNHCRACEKKGAQTVGLQTLGKTKYVPLFEVPQFLANIYPQRDLLEINLGLSAFLWQKGSMTHEMAMTLLDKTKPLVLATKNGTELDPFPGGSNNAPPKKRARVAPKTQEGNMDRTMNETMVGTRDMAMNSAAYATPTALLVAQVSRAIEMFASEHGLSHAHLLSVSHTILSMPLTKRIKTVNMTDEARPGGLGGSEGSFGKHEAISMS